MSDKELSLQHRRGRGITLPSRLLPQVPQGRWGACQVDAPLSQEGSIAAQDPQAERSPVSCGGCWQTCLGFLSGSVGKECPQRQRHRRLGFYPWIGKIPWRRKWQPTPVFLPEKSHGQRSLAGYSPEGWKRVMRPGTQTTLPSLSLERFFVGQKAPLARCPRELQPPPSKPICCTDILEKIVWHSWRNDSTRLVY